MKDHEMRRTHNAHNKTIPSSPFPISLFIFYYLLQRVLKRKEKIGRTLIQSRLNTFYGSTTKKCLSFHFSFAI